MFIVMHLFADGEIVGPFLTQFTANQWRNRQVGDWVVVHLTNPIEVY